MKIQVVLEDDEVVEDWSQFRDYFDDAASELGMHISVIIHKDGEER